MAEIPLTSAFNHELIDRTPFPTFARSWLIQRRRHRRAGISHDVNGKSSWKCNLSSSVHSRTAVGDFYFHSNFQSSSSGLDYIYAHSVNRRKPALAANKTIKRLRRACRVQLAKTRRSLTPPTESIFACLPAISSSQVDYVLYSKNSP